MLITGETGSGKELVARALHAQGPAPRRLFLAINCAAIPHDLLENQLFGHVRGAYTGADRDHAGLFIAAGAGTVFLDEIARALPRRPRPSCCGPSRTRRSCPSAPRGHPVPGQDPDRDQQRPGGRGRGRPIPRRICTYRLNVVTIHLPPLRDRREDIPELVSVLSPSTP